MTAKVIQFLFLILMNTTAANAGALSDLRNFETLAASSPDIIHSRSLKLLNGKIPPRYVLDQIEYSILTETELKNLESQLRQKNYGNEYQKDGCYAKSHLISYELDRIGIKHGKIFISGTDIGDINVIGSDLKNIPFKFHIAPVVLVQQQDQQLIPYVLDLSFFSNAPRYDQWMNLFLKKSIRNKLTIQIVSPRYIDPTWELPADMIYNNEYLYRFENEVKAINQIIKNKRPSN